MKNTCLTTAFIALIFIMTSCEQDDLYTGEGNLITKEINIEEFNEIIVLGSHKVNITKGAVQKVEVTGFSNIIDRLENQVHHNLWYIDLKKGNYRNASLTFNIQLPVLNKAITEGSGEIFIDDFVSDDSVHLGVLGSGKITTKTNIGCKNLNISIEGSGKVYQTEKFQDLQRTNIEIIGSGKYDGFSSQTEFCNINIEGSADCNVNVDSILKGKIRGSGTINYIGTPSIDSSISGSGKINNGN